MQARIVTAPDLENPDEGDLYLRDGQAVLTSTLAEEVAQTLRVRFQFFRGEWFLDLREGLPWFEAVFEKTDERVVRAVLAQVVAGTPGVAAVLSLAVNVDTRTRAASIAFVAQLKDGTILNSADFGAFVVGDA